MTAPAVGLIAALVVVLVMAPGRPARRLAGGSRSAPLRGGQSPTPARAAPAPLGFAALGSAFRRVGRLTGSPLSDTMLGVLVVASLPSLLVAPPVPPLLGAGLWAQAALARGRRRARHAQQLTRVLPDAVDLFLLCASAGLSLPLAHPLVAERAGAPLAEALAAAHVAATGGRPRADALLDALVPLGERAAALAHVLVDHLRYGVPLVPALERLSLELRLHRRRAAEEEARRVPVRLLGPLVTCVLPAFGLLTVVPLLAASLQALPR